MFKQIYTIIGVNNYFNRVVLIHKLAVLHQTISTTMYCTLYYFSLFNMITIFYYAVFHYRLFLIWRSFFLQSREKLFQFQPVFFFFFAYIHFLISLVLLFIFFCFSIRSCLQTNWNTNMVVIFFFLFVCDSVLL